MFSGPLSALTLIGGLGGLLPLSTQPRPALCWVTLFLLSIPRGRTIGPKVNRDEQRRPSRAYDDTEPSDLASHASLYRLGHRERPAAAGVRDLGNVPLVSD